MGNEIRGASENDPLLEVDARRRITLGALAQHRRYLATVQDSGQILLTPATIVPAGDVAQQIQDTIDHPEHRVRRGRPARN